MSTSSGLRLTAVVSTIALLTLGCGGSGEAPVPGGAAGAGDAPEEPVDLELPATGIEGGPDFDLDGVEITVTTSAPGAINVNTFFAYQRLREWGADVEVIVLTTTTGVQTLVAGRADIASQGSDEVVLGTAEGADVVAIGAPSTRMDYVLVADTDYPTVESLEGSAVAMSGPAGFDALLGRIALDQAGLDPGSDVNFVQIGGSPERATALLSGQADAATIFLEDWEELRRKTEDVEALAYMGDIVPDFPASAYFAQRSYWDDNPEVAQALACANLQANAWTLEDKDRWVDYVLEVVDGATEEATSAIYDLALEVDMYPTDPDELFSVEGLDGLVGAMQEAGDISEPVEPSQMADTSYLEEAAQQGCGEV